MDDWSDFYYEDLAIPSQYELAMLKCDQQNEGKAKEEMQQALAKGLDHHNICAQLDLACFIGNASVVELLITHYKEKDYSLDNDNTSDTIIKWKSLKSLLNHFNRDCGDTPLLLALRGKQCSKRLPISKLLLEAGADVNLSHPMSKKTPLISAITQGNCEMVELLIENGADTQLCDNVGISPLYSAIMHGKTDLVSKLIEAGCDVNVGSQDHTPLFIATKLGQMGTVKVL